MFVFCTGMKNREIIIAIDGHSSTGKSTFARAIGVLYKLVYIDTGALYRGVTFLAHKNGLNQLNTIESVDKIKSLLDKTHFEFLPTGPHGDGELYMNQENIEKEIRSLEIAQKVSTVAAIPLVRNFVDSMLKEYGAKGGVVMDGRDIGTVVFPNAQLKIFMTAQPQIRARRRFNEIIANGGSANYEEVLKNVQERDYLDEHRQTAPLKRAPDAILLDNSYMTQEDQMQWIEKIIKEKWN